MHFRLMANLAFSCSGYSRVDWKTELTGRHKAYPREEARTWEHSRPAPRTFHWKRFP